MKSGSTEHSFEFYAGVMNHEPHVHCPLTLFDRSRSLLYNAMKVTDTVDGCWAIPKTSGTNWYVYKTFLVNKVENIDFSKY